jgi:hypothetical protein
MGLREVPQCTELFRKSKNQQREAKGLDEELGRE